MTDYFEYIEKAVKKENQFLKTVSSCPIIEIIGIVGPDGGGGGQIGRQKLWTLVFTLEAYRINNGEIIKKPLSFKRKVTERELRNYQEKIEGEKVIKIKARISTRNVYKQTQGYLEKYIRVIKKDSELNDYLKELNKPKKIKVAKLGTFNYDRSVSWYSAKTKWNNKKITLVLEVDNPENYQKQIEIANTMWKDQSILNKEVVDYAIKKLLPLKNSTWLEEEGEKEVTSKKFKSLMDLNSIFINTKKGFEFIFDDGGLFYGHQIQVLSNSKLQPKKAYIQG
jgi:hypothetical protein